MKLRKSFLLFQILFLILIGALIYMRMQNRPELPVLGALSTFTLTDSDGKDFSSETLNGKVWVANFIFTSCSGPCPMMTTKMKQLYRSYVMEKSVDFVSISVDPEVDVPSKLNEYARQHDADTRRWHFLTGSKADIKKISREIFKLGLDDDPMSHSTRFVLVDGKRQVRGYYDGTDTEDVARLFKDVAAQMRKDAAQ